MKTIAISDLATMENPTDGWYHLEANNDHPKKRKDGSILVQVLDNAAMEAICAAWVRRAGSVLPLRWVRFLRHRLSSWRRQRLAT